MCKMVAAASELPTTGYALEVDGRAQELKRRFPMLQIKVYDAETRTREEI